MNSKQKIHANILIQVRRFRETKKRQEKNEEEEKEKTLGKAREKQTNKKMIGCFIYEVFYDRS